LAQVDGAAWKRQTLLALDPHVLDQVQPRPDRNAEVGMPDMARLMVDIAPSQQSGLFVPGRQVGKGNDAAVGAGLASPHSKSDTEFVGEALQGDSETADDGC